MPSLANEQMVATNDSINQPNGSDTIPNGSTTSPNGNGAAPIAPSVLTIANLHIIDDISIQQYDSVQISMELFLRLFPNEAKSSTNDDTRIASKADYFIMVKFLGAPDYFDHFKVYKISAINHNGPTDNSITFINDRRSIR